MASFSYTLGTTYDPQNSTSVALGPSVYTGPDRAYTTQYINSEFLDRIIYLLRSPETTNLEQLYAGDRIPVSFNIDFSDNNASVDLVGGDYSDIIRGGSGDDTLNGGGGNDVLDGGLGQNTIDGGAGVNTVSYEHYQGRGAPIGVRVDLEAGAARESFPIPLVDSIQDTLINMQNIRGSAFADVLRGDAKRNVIEGGGGADTIIGVGAGDFASYLNSAEGVVVNLTTGVNTAGDAQDDQLSSIDNLYGSLNADSLTGNDNANLLYGQGGADSLFGEGGNDKLFVRGNPNSVDGGDGNDQLQLTGGGTFTFTDDSFTGIEGVVVNGGQTANFAGVTSGVLISSRSLANGTAATIVGGSGADRIKAGFAGDTISGGAGNDVLSVLTKLPNGDPAPNSVETFVYGASGFGRDLVYGVDVTEDHIRFTAGPNDFGDLLITAGNANGPPVTTITIKGQSQADAIVLRGVSAADVNAASDSFFQFG